MTSIARIFPEVPKPVSARLRRNGLAICLALPAVAPFLSLLRESFAGGGRGFTALLSSSQFYMALANSVFLATVQTLAGLTLASLAGYALSRRPNRGLLLAIIGLAALPPQLLLPGGFELVGALHLFDSRLAVLMPGSLNMFAVLLYRQAFRALPGEVVEASRLDGATEWRVWWEVALPMVRPTTAALMVLSFAGSWNAVVWPLLVLQRSALETLPMRLTILSGTALGPAEQATALAGTVLGILPVVVLFLLLQRDFLPILKGASKG